MQRKRGLLQPVTRRMAALVWLPPIELRADRANRSVWVRVLSGTGPWKSRFQRAMSHGSDRGRVSALRYTDLEHTGDRRVGARELPTAVLALHRPLGSLSAT